MVLKTDRFVIHICSHFKLILQNLQEIFHLGIGKVHHENVPKHTTHTQ